jgi:hypothetical protein
MTDLERLSRSVETLTTELQVSRISNDARQKQIEQLKHERDEALGMASHADERHRKASRLIGEMKLKFSERNEIR